MIVSDYNQFGGKHYESAAIRNTMAHAGVVAPHTGEPLTEAMCFGIAGGIGIGYSYCPSIPGYGMGSGVTIIGRYALYSTAGRFYREFFERIGAKTDVRESGGVKAAHKNLCEGLEAGKPVIVWTSPLSVCPDHWAGTCGMYSTVVHGIDEEKNEAYIGDRAPASLTIPLDYLQEARSKVCSHKNRSLTFDPPKNLTAESLGKAALSGIRASVQDFLKPRIKTFSLPGLEEWSKLVTNGKNKKGWVKAFPGAQIYLPLRDTFESIETASTGGSLFRPLYADFLDEAAEVTGRKTLRKVADTCRKLGKKWSDLAEATLPDKIKPFKQTKDALRKRVELFEKEGAKGLKKIDKHGEQLDGLEKVIVDSFPLDEAKTMELLDGLREQIVELLRLETDAIHALKDAAA